MKAFFNSRPWKVVKWCFFGYLPVSFLQSYVANASQFDRRLDGATERYRVLLMEHEQELLTRASIASGRSKDDLFANAYFRSRLMKAERLWHNLHVGWENPHRVYKNVLAFNGHVFESSPLRTRAWKRGDTAFGAFTMTGRPNQGGLSFDKQGMGFELKYQGDLQVSYWQPGVGPRFHVPLFSSPSVASYLSNIPQDFLFLYRRCLLASAKAKLLRDCRLLTGYEGFVARSVKRVRGVVGY